METMLGIALYNYLYLKIAKMLSYYRLCVLFNELEKRAKQVLLGSEGVGQEGSRHQAEVRDGPNNVCMHI
jgi:hypothetical protein